MRLMVTGTSGFVGGAIGRFARQQGAYVVGVSRSAPRQEATDHAVTHDLRRALDWTDPLDVVVHAAALSAPWGRPATFDAVNVDGTRHALAVARQCGARFVLISSSSVLYDAGDQLALPEEDAPQTPSVNAYARTKRAAERLVADADLDTLILRPRAVFGVGDTVLFPRIARAARMRFLPRFDRADPAIGDLVSIDNLVRQVWRAITQPQGGVLHLVDPAPVPIEAFVAKALAEVGLPGPTITVPVATARRVAGWLEALSARTGWWEPPLTRFGVDVFAASKTFDTAKAQAALGPPDIPTDLALSRFASWWRGGASLGDAALGRVGGAP